MALRRRADPEQAAAGDADQASIAKMSREDLQADLRERGLIGAVRAAR